MKRRYIAAIFIGFALGVELASNDAQAEAVLVADKKEGYLAVVDVDTKKVLHKEPALFGRSHENQLNMNYYDKNIANPGITPAGPYTLEKIYSLRLNEPMLVFVNGEYSVGAIHPLWMGNPDQNRVKRLESKTPDDNHITGGCINVDSKFFYDVLDKLPDNTIINILPE
jgi:hypothetical protein